MFVRVIIYFFIFLFYGWNFCGYWRLALNGHPTILTDMVMLNTLPHIFNSSLPDANENYLTWPEFFYLEARMFLYAVKHKKFIAMLIGAYLVDTCFWKILQWQSHSFWNWAMLVANYFWYFGNDGQIITFFFEYTQELLFNG